MSVLPSMVHRSGDTLVVRSVVSGDPIYQDEYSSTKPDQVQSLKQHERLQNRPQGQQAYHLQQQEQFKQEQDLPECKVKRNYSCATCDFFTQNPRHYLYHLRDVHREKVKVYECPSCLYASKHYQKLLRHTRMVHGRTTNNASATTLVSDGSLTSASSAGAIQARRKRGSGTTVLAIKEESNTGDEAIQTSAAEDEDQGEEEDDDDEDHNPDGDDIHAAVPLTRNDVGSGKFRCGLCSYLAKSQQQLTRHESEVHIRTKFFRCTKCSYVTHIKARYTKHVKYHSMPMIKCDLCDFRTPYKWNLDRHCKNHNGRGAFRCSACNFTADIKQSLTVHEMNHHVPPVGQAAMAAAAAAAAASAAAGAGGGVECSSVAGALLGAVGGNRRRNKVGASDSAAFEDQVEEHLAHTKLKTKHLSELLGAHNTSITPSTAPTAAYTSADFIDPDDIVERPNGHIYLKTQCKRCSFKTAYHAEMAKHERAHHSGYPPPPAKPKKTPRPVPNLIPIRSPTNMLSPKDVHEICARSTNSVLKDYASLFSSEDVFHKPSLKPSDPMFKQKNASFFDKLKDKLSHTSSTNMICQHCGHESKCWTESAAHQKLCGKENDRITDNGTPPLYCTNNNNTASVLSSTRCQYCRQRCKSSADLYNHMQTCVKYQQENELLGEEDDDDEPEHMEIEMRPEDILSVEEQQQENCEDVQQPHPMENRVFVWNDIEVPINIDVDEVGGHQIQPDYSPYYNFMNDAVRQNGVQDVDDVSLDLSIRTQSPAGEATPPPVINSKPAKQSNQNSSNIFGKVPTHGNDISIAQHKRVFKCPHCSFWASTASRFHVHIVGHLNKKPFECSLCAYRSNWRWDITKHIKLKSVRDPNHESARVLMTDETGRRNYTKYNKYLTEINVPNGNADGSASSSGGAGTRNAKLQPHVLVKVEELSPLPSGNRHSASRPPPDLKMANSDLLMMARLQAAAAIVGQQTPVSAGRDSGRKRGGEGAATPELSGESKRTLYKCSRCNFRDSSHEKLLDHIQRQHCAPPSLPSSADNTDTIDITCQPDMAGLMLPSVLPAACSSPPPSSDDNTSYDNTDGRSTRLSSPYGFADDLGLGASSATAPDLAGPSRGGSSGATSAPFSCGHCHQRHCRLKHHGDISVIVGGRPGHPDRVESDRQPDEPEHMDLPQLGAHKCAHCPYSTDVPAELAGHSLGHEPAKAPTVGEVSEAVCCKCPLCGYAVTHQAEMYAHLPLHGVADPVDYLQRVNESDPSKRHKCAACPYVTNSRSQYMYHKRFHKPKNGPYKCSKCNYNVTRRHLLHQHMKVHSSGKSDFIDLDEMDDLSNSGPETNHPSMSPPSTTNTTATTIDIPLIWVSRAGKFSKMYKCRHCPHVNTRKVNIQEHEKMHASSAGGAGAGADGKAEGEHRCAQCDYVCNNAGVLSSHIKVHQGAFGILHCLVDPQKTDDEQIHTLTLSLHQLPKYHHLTSILSATAAVGDDVDDVEEDEDVPEPPTDVNLAASLAESGDMLFFCHECPARFLKAKEFEIHGKLHGGRLFYKCEYCSYTGRQRPHLNSHAMVHTSEYKRRTANLRSIYPTHPSHPAPQLLLFTRPGAADCWMVAPCSTTATTSPPTSHTDRDHNTATVELDSDTDINDNNIREAAEATDLSWSEQQRQQQQHGRKSAMQSSASTILAESLMRTTRHTAAAAAAAAMSVPLSGTDLFRHRQLAESQLKVEEEEGKEAKESFTSKKAEEEEELSGGELSGDGQATFGAGNPDFIYPMCTKNGRQKEKRYKCAKCPTAFEKRDQYKVHLGLHGSRQRFQCTECDYSVANSSNFVQHQRKHTAHKDALASASASAAAAAAATTPATAAPIEEPKAPTVSPSTGTLYRCTHCPYSSRRRDAVDNHMKRHESVSGVRQLHACDHCDYSVTQAHILRDHVKMHFAPGARPQAEAYLAPELTVKSVVTAAARDMDTDRVIYDSKMAGTSKRRRSSNNSDSGAKVVLVNGDTGEVVSGGKGDSPKK